MARILITLLVSLLVASAVPRTAPAATPKRQPNVVLIFSDDQGTLDVGCYGARDLRTPHLDALAKRGVRFTQCYTAAPVCSPSRAALLTGRYPQRAGLTTNAPSQPGGHGMPTEQLTLAELMKGAGYKTALFGKWHLGTVPECEPNGQGFDEFYGHKSGCIDNYSHFFYWSGPPVHDLWRNQREVHEDGKHFSELIAREAKRFISNNRDRPFFLYLPFNTPHYPLQAQERYREWYEGLPEPRRSYAASVSSFDGAVGEVVEHLDRLRLRENTLVVFLSDHGHSTEERTNFGGGFAGEYRGSKFGMFEGGIRVPCIASFPGKLPAGAVREQLVTSIDWFPTIAELCGVTLPARKLDGRSLTAVLGSAAAKSPHEVFHWQLGNQWAVREGDWKLMVNARDTDGKPVPEAERTFLANLRTDPAERRNHAPDQPALLSRLRALHASWAAEVTAQ